MTAIRVKMAAMRRRRTGALGRRRAHCIACFCGAAPASSGVCAGPWQSMHLVSLSAIRVEIDVLVVLGDEIRRASVAGEASEIRVRALDLDGLRVVARRVVVDVAEPFQLGAHRAEHAVVAVARVALVGLDVAVLVVLRGERVARGIAEVGHVALHGVAVTARVDGHGLAHPVRRGEEHDDRGENDDRSENQGLRSGGQSAPVHHSPEEEDGHDVQDRENETDPPDPLARRADPAVGRGDAEVRRVRAESRRRREDGDGRGDSETTHYLPG